MGSEPWQLKMQHFLRTTVDKYPKQKIVGICWGHQTIAVTFGGVVSSMPNAELGVTPLTLTEAGQKMFPFANGGVLNMHEYHRREITTSARGFRELAVGSQSFVNEANTIMTFQGHPEMTESVAKSMFANVPSYMGVSEEEKGAIEERMELPHDGMGIWKRILEWVKEE